MKIKSYFLFFFLILCGNFSVSAQNVMTKDTSIIHITDNNHLSVTFKNDQFYDWLAKQSPKHKYLSSSLEIENLQYVTEWNKRVGNIEYDANLYTQQIDYKIKPRLHYGLDVNYKLYMYFKFFEEKYEKLLL